MMRRAAALFAITAAIPAMTGPVAAETGREMMIALCGGGAMAVPFDQAPARGGEGNSACCAKGCHSGQSRKKASGAQ
jgi:hypothetical protein